jgi:chemotaxis protein MotA
MELSTVSGLGLGLLILVLALLLGHVPPQTLFNPEALLIVFGGTMTATLVSFNQATLMNALGALRGGTAEGRMNTRDTIQYVMDVVGFVRDEGILALQPIIESIEIPFFKKGLNLVLDNRSEKFVRDSLSTEIEVIYRQEMDCARVYETAGGYAPTMGIIGAVIGLIFIVQAFHDPAQLGQGVASAFSATLYGVALSNLFLLPVAGKLRQRARDEWFIRTLLLEAILSIRSGEHPLLIQERLNAFLYQPEHDGASRPGKAYASRPTGLPSASAGLGYEPGLDHSILPDDFLQIGAEE